MYNLRFTNISIIYLVYLVLVPVEVFIFLALLIAIIFQNDKLFQHWHLRGIISITRHHVRTQKRYNLTVSHLIVVIRVYLRQQVL